MMRGSRICGVPEAQRQFVAASEMLRRPCGLAGSARTGGECVEHASWLAAGLPTVSA